MRTETRVVRIGENVGPIPGDYDYDADRSDGGTDSRYHVAQVERWKALLDALARGEKWEATTDGGMPRVGWGEVLEVGMYDGWPFWRPIPSFWLAGFLGGSWHWWGSLSDTRPLRSAR